MSSQTWFSEEREISFIQGISIYEETKRVKIFCQKSCRIWKASWIWARGISSLSYLSQIQIFWTIFRSRILILGHVCMPMCVWEREREKGEGERESQEVKSSFPKKWQASLSKLILIKHITNQLSNPEEKNLLISKHSKSLLPHDLFASLLSKTWEITNLFVDFITAFFTCWLMPRKTTSKVMHTLAIQLRKKRLQKLCLSLIHGKWKCNPSPQISWCWLKKIWVVGEQLPNYHFLYRNWIFRHKIQRTSVYRARNKRIKSATSSKCMALLWQFIY